MEPDLISLVLTLSGDAAVNVLNGYLSELENSNETELTEKQVKALVKFAQGLRSAIEAERASTASNPLAVEIPITSELKRMARKQVNKRVNRARASEKSRSLFQTILKQQGYSRKAAEEIWKWYDHLEMKGDASW